MDRYPEMGDYWGIFRDKKDGVGDVLNENRGVERD